MFFVEPCEVPTDFNSINEDIEIYVAVRTGVAAYVAAFQKNRTRAGIFVADPYRRTLKDCIDVLFRPEVFGPGHCRHA
ncbi:hypothetical protein A5784_04370 [Mycobacterium sp. 852013-50091_SCH5140682]|nr:hypothetical protein A5784_04370 [Mycobacterium sp. 852013-50091_SCH5140682]